MRIISNFVLLAIIILQYSCYISGYQTLNKNQTSQREKKYASHLALEEKYSVYLDSTTTKERSAFVTDYAYEENPNEDMAESIGFYFVYPDKLRSCCPEKYEFIHNRIMLTYGKRWSTSNIM